MAVSVYANDSGVWVLGVGCNVQGDPGVFLQSGEGNIFADGNEGDEHSLFVEIDDAVEEQTWGYFPGDGGNSDYYSAKWASHLIKRILKSESITFTIPASGDDYVVTFSISGLSQYIGQATDVFD